MVIQDLRFEFQRYVNNDIPIRLLAWDADGNLSLIGRNAVRTHFQGVVDNLTEADIAATEWESERQDAIQTLVRSTVKYAALSHRWSDEEVSFQEFGHGAEENKGSFGWRKIRAFCNKARDYGVVFAWVDTCCIDKTSSAELDESIRSMFRWYQNSTICVAHLAATTDLESMERDEWFERGWTLQELLAPPKIRFYAQDWRTLSDADNDKERTSVVLERVSQITGINMDEICDFVPSSFQRVDRRMVWAANRRVTRDEDMAYSLMGIFNVSISIAYGEGHDRAFSRLVETIIMAGGHISVLNWGGIAAAHPVSTAIPASPKSYVGHPDLGQIYGPSYFTRVAELDMALTNRGLCIPVVLIPVDFAWNRVTEARSGSRDIQIGLTLRQDISVSWSFGGVTCSDELRFRPVMRREHSSSSSIHQITVTPSKIWKKTTSDPREKLFLCVTHYFRFPDSGEVKLVSPLTGFSGKVRILYSADTRVERIPTMPISIPFGNEGDLSQAIERRSLQKVYF